MFQASATIYATPEQRAEVARTLSSIVEPTEAEPGCLSCGCYADARDPNAIYFVERWRSREDFERHVRGSRFRVLLSVVDLSAAEPELSFDEIVASGGICYIEQVMGLSMPDGP
jgi:quinol monooxygenase YgiN